MLNQCQIQIGTRQHLSKYSIDLVWLLKEYHIVCDSKRTKVGCYFFSYLSLMCSYLTG